MASFRAKSCAGSCTASSVNAVRIEQMFSHAAIVSIGRATLKGHYAVALASCCKREDILRCHREANRPTLPRRRPGEPLNLATSRHELAVRTVASVGCPLAQGT